MNGLIGTSRCQQLWVCSCLCPHAHLLTYAHVQLPVLDNSISFIELFYMTPSWADLLKFSVGAGYLVFVFTRASHGVVRQSYKDEAPFYVYHGWLISHTIEPCNKTSFICVTLNSVSERCEMSTHTLSHDFFTFYSCNKLVVGVIKAVIHFLLP